MVWPVEYGILADAYSIPWCLGSCLGVWVITHVDTHVALCLYILSSIPPFHLCLNDLCVSLALSTGILTITH